RRHLVGDERPASHEELDGQHAGVIKALQQTASVRLRLFLQRRMAVGGRRITQDAGFMRIRAQRIETCFACSAAYGDDGDLATEVDESFVDERRRAELLPGGRHVLRAAQETLS